MHVLKSRRAQVVFSPEVVEENPRRIARVGRPQPHLASGFRPHRSDMRLEAVAVGVGFAVVAHGDRKKVVLDVRIVDAGSGPNEGAGFELVRCSRTGFEKEPSCADQRLSDQVPVFVERDRLNALLLNVDFGVVLKIPAHTAPVGDNLDVQVRQFSSGTDPGKD